MKRPASVALDATLEDDQLVLLANCREIHIYLHVPQETFFLLEYHFLERVVQCFWLRFETFGKRLSDQEREYQSRLGVDLDWGRSELDLSPRHALVRACASVGTVKLLRGIYKDGMIGSISHEVRVIYMVFDKSTTEHDHSGPLGGHSDRIDRADVLNEIHDKVRPLERKHIYHICIMTWVSWPLIVRESHWTTKERTPERAVGQSGAEDGDIVLPRPIIDAILVVNFLSQACDDL